MRERPVGDVGEDLFHDRVIPVLSLGLDQLERGVSEQRVVAPEGEQLALARGGPLVQVPDPADDQPGGDRLPLLRRERRVLRLGDPGVGDPGAQLVIPDRPGILDGRPGILGEWPRSRP